LKNWCIAKLAGVSPPAMLMSVTKTGAPVVKRSVVVTPVGLVNATV
jgi:hypothetical protein